MILSRALIMGLVGDWGDKSAALGRYRLEDFPGVYVAAFSRHFPVGPSAWLLGSTCSSRAGVDPQVARGVILLSENAELRSRKSSLAVHCIPGRGMDMLLSRAEQRALQAGLTTARSVR